MFAVKGWNLGQVVTETAQKKKLKRKRNDREESREQTDATSIKGLRNNPFAIRQMQPPKPPVKSDPPNGHKNPAIDNRSNDDVSGLRNADTGSESSVKRAEKALKKDKKRHQRKLKSAANVIETPSVEIEKQTTSSARAVTNTTSTFTPLQEKMRQKLSGSQFRHINEKLYTTHSSDALSLFTNEPSLFHNYHEGFRHQVQSWPTNPIDIFIKLVSSSSKSKKTLVIADLGCGDAALAQHFHKKKGIKVHSFDLVKVNEFVQVCDMANVPLAGESVDIAVFCLSLMGTNFLAFIREACRYTKLHGEIWIAEIKSRFVDSTFKTFIQRLSEMGLKLLDLNQKEKMFVIMRFEKVTVLEDDTTGADEKTLLKACLYKKR